MEPSYRRPLNKQQLQILCALYKFRFGTEELLAVHTNSSRRYTHERLRILTEQEYIGRRYDSSYKLAGRGAEYYLAGRGIEILKQHPKDFRIGLLRNIKKDENASNRFVRHSITIFSIYARLVEAYGDALRDSFHFYTRSYMFGDKAEGFPKPLPDSFASFRTTRSEPIEHYLIECFDDTMPQSVIRNRIGQLIDHADSGEWELTNTYPRILLVCQTEKMQKNIVRWVIQEIDRSWLDSLKVEVVTLEGLQSLGNGDSDS